MIHDYLLYCKLVRSHVGENLNQLLIFLFLYLCVQFSGVNYINVGGILNEEKL